MVSIRGRSGYFYVWKKIEFFIENQHCTSALENFNAFSPVEKAVILIVPQMQGGQELVGEVSAPSIEVNFVDF